MNDTRLYPDDPKLTAYALGELAGDERAAVEAALRLNPALRATVDEIRATASQLEAALAGEPIFRPAQVSASTADIVIKLNGHAAESVIATAARSPSENQRVDRAVPGNDEYAHPRTASKLIRFPQFYYVVGTAAAACVAVLVALRDDPRPMARSRERTIRHEIILAPATTTSGESQPDRTNEPEPVESRVVEFPSISPVPTDPASAPESAHVSSGSNSPAFIAGNLSLISQAKQDPGSLGQEPLATRPGTNRTHSAEPQKSISSQGPIEFQAIPSNPTGTTPPLFSEALSPPVAGPVVAGSTPPSVLPHQPSRDRNVVTSTTTPGSGDVVMLSPFTVTAERAAGFATQGNAQGAASDKRGATGRDDRPHAPSGAKFGRNTEAYSHIRDNNFLAAAQNQLSTFSIDVDSASYANIRRMIEQGSTPQRDAVRIEEMVNYFPYRYAPPKGDTPFAVALEVADAPWAPTHRLVRIGLKAREVSTAQRPAASLVFLLDVSGSMNQPNKLPLVKESMRLLLGKLRADDRVAIVTYAGDSGLALASTPVTQRREIINALDDLTPGGSTNGAMGIQLAYEIAKENFVRHGINRVILCTDGDFNVGTTSEGELVRLIEEKATSGVFLTVLGFGMGNYKDATLEKLADKGNGNYGYIDTRREAEKLLVEQVSSTLVTVAKDVKIQVEFNPATVSSYRLIGYENRLLRKEDFNNDSVDAGEIGAGHTVTALYEIVPVGAEDRARDEPPLDELRYAARGAVSSRLEMPSGKRDPLSNELLNVKVRYKKPYSLFSFPKTLEFPLLNATTTFARASADFRFAAAVAQFGMILRDSPHRGVATLRDVAAWAATAAASPTDDPSGYRAEFVDLVRKTQAMTE